MQQDYQYSSATPAIEAATSAYDEASLDNSDYEVESYGVPPLPSLSWPNQNFFKNFGVLEEPNSKLAKSQFLFVTHGKS